MDIDRRKLLRTIITEDLRKRLSPEEIKLYLLLITSIDETKEIGKLTKQDIEKCLGYSLSVGQLEKIAHAFRELQLAEIKYSKEKSEIRFTLLPRTSWVKEGEMKLEEIAEKIKKLTELELDVLRIIEVYGGVLWTSEVQLSLKNFYDELDRGASVESKDLNIALQNLEESKLISIEQRTRGRLDSVDTYQDGYICLRYPELTRLALAQDRTLMRYKLIIGKELDRKFDKPTS
jgi:hypothetical protein